MNSLMKLKISFILLTFFLSCTRAQTLKEGDKVPMFKLYDQNGQLFDLADYVGKQKLVIYFYPKDDTPGCTKQACTFRDQYEVFKDAGAMVIGISGQSIESHKNFAEKYQLPFSLLSDEKNEVRKMFGASSGVIPGRVTFVVDKSGKIVLVFNSQSKVEEHVKLALEKIKSID